MQPASQPASQPFVALATCDDNSVAQIAPVATMVAIPVDGNGSDVVAIQNPGEAVAATVIEPPEAGVA